MATAYDHYAELVQTRRAAEHSVALQSVQAALLSNMSSSLSSIHAEMEEVRRATQEGLAIQQELLNREIIQNQIEEFIYQMGKLLAEFSSKESVFPLSQQYFLVRGVLETIEPEGIGTPVIKDCDNKEDFEKAKKDYEALCVQLEGQEEVKEAIAWAESEQKRLEDKTRADEAERRRIEAERKRAEEERTQQRELELKELYGKLQELKSSRQSLKFGDWYKEKFSWIDERSELKSVPSVARHALLWCFGWFAIPIYFIVSVAIADKETNRHVDSQIKRTKEEIRCLEEKSTFVDGTA